MLRRVGEKAAQHGITIGLEVVNRYESNVLNTAAQAVAFARRVALPNVKVHLDTYHMNIEEADIESALIDTGAMLGYFHIGESGRGYLGAGNIDFDRVFRGLAKVRLRRADHLRVLLVGGGQPAAVGHPRDLAQLVGRQRRPRPPRQGLHRERRQGRGRGACAVRAHAVSREIVMEHRRLGGAGLKVPALSLGTGTFGGSTAFFERWGQTQGAQAQRMVDLCLDHGVTLFDTADVYSDGVSEQVLGQALKGKRHAALISTKASFAMGGAGPNDKGSSRHYLMRACEAEPAAAADRSHRSVLHARLRCADAGGGDAAGARRPRAQRQDRLHRRLQLLGLAPDEGARRHASGMAWPATWRTRATTR